MIQGLKNSSVTPLSNGEIFVGLKEEFAVTSVMVTIATDQNGVMYVEFSPDGVNWDTSLSFQYNTSRINPPHILEVGGRYTRVRFENNSGSDQTYLRLYTYFSDSMAKLTSPINGLVAENYDATLVRPTKYEYEVAMGKRQGRETWNIFGYNTDVDNVSPEIVASFGGTFNIMTNADNLDIVSSSSNDTDGGTGANTVYIEGIDADSNMQNETITLNGTTPVTTTKTWLGVNRVFVLSTGSLNTNAGVITVDDNGGTVGTQASIPATYSVTQQSIFHIPINYKFLNDWIFVNSRKLAGGSSPRVTVRGWSYSRVTDTYYEIIRLDIDTTVENTVQLNPSQPFVLGGREVLYFTAETDTNNTTCGVRFSGSLERVL